LLAGAGVGVALGAWAALVALGIEPTATVVDGQPGGVAGEVVLGTFAGAVGRRLARSCGGGVEVVRGRDEAHVAERLREVPE
jgi:hypothetical protein